MKTNQKKEIPKGWEISNIKKIGTYVNGKAFKPSEWQKTGVPIIRIQNLSDESNKFNYSKDNYDKKYEINDNDILVSWSASLGCFKWKRGKAVLNQHIFKAIPHDVVRLDFFYYVLSNSIQKMKKLTHGSTMQHITLKPFLDTQILLPNFKEQKEISSILSNIDNLILTTQKEIEQTKSQKIGLMQKLLIKGIGHTKFKKVSWLFGNEIEIPKEWEIKTIKQIGNTSAGGTPSRSNNQYWYKGTIPWLSSGEIRNNMILSSNEKITELGLKKSAAKIFTKGTILIAITGQGKTRGRTGLLKIDSSTNQSVVGIKTNNKIFNIYLWHYLQNQYKTLRSISHGSNKVD